MNKYNSKEIIYQLKKTNNRLSSHYLFLNHYKIEINQSITEPHLKPLLWYHETQECTAEEKTITDVEQKQNSESQLSAGEGVPAGAKNQGATRNHKGEGREVGAAPLHTP